MIPISSPDSFNTSPVHVPKLMNTRAPDIERMATLRSSSPSISPSPQQQHPEYTGPYIAPRPDSSPNTTAPSMYPDSPLLQHDRTRELARANLPLSSERTKQRYVTVAKARGRKAKERTAIEFVEMSSLVRVGELQNDEMIQPKIGGQLKFTREPNTMSVNEIENTSEAAYEFENQLSPFHDPDELEERMEYIASPSPKDKKGRERKRRARSSLSRRPAFKQQKLASKEATRNDQLKTPTKSSPLSATSHSKFDASWTKPYNMGQSLAEYQATLDEEFCALQRQSRTHYRKVAMRRYTGTNRSQITKIKDAKRTAELDQSIRFYREAQASLREIKRKEDRAANGECPSPLLSL